MFEVAEVGRKLAKPEFRAQAARIRPALLEAQRAIADKKIAVVLLVGGVDGAGKGEVVNLLTEWMDPRGVQVNVFGPPTEEERDRPGYWRFWMSLPPRGRIGIYFGSWYTDLIVDRVFDRSKKSEFQQGIQDVLGFERQLGDDGILIVKLWFHLSKKAQRRRLKALEADKKTRWRVSKEDWRRLKRYDRFRDVSELVLQASSTRHAPWTLIEGKDHNYRSITAARALLDALKARIAVENKPPKAPHVLPEPAAPAAEAPALLERLKPAPAVSNKEYRAALETLQGRLFRLAREASEAGLSTVVAFEGSDAAGKGGNIRRLAQGMDARNYRVIPIAAPTDEERAHPYLWRFWRSLPRAGRVTIFDRSWYGRVLVERVEGFCAEADWRRAYAEINEFEEHLHRHDTIIVKFWIAVSKEEQLRRFKERQRLAFKRFKITAEDWRNREKWDAYAAAVEEMVARTSTPFAPWTIVDGNNKPSARLHTIETLCQRLQAAL